MEQKKGKLTIKQKIKQGGLFIFIGIPGLCMFLYSAFLIIFCMFEPGLIKDNWKLLLLSIFMLPAGAFAILAGTGNMGKKLYIIVFLTFPIAFLLFGVLFSLADPTSKGVEAILSSGVVTAIVYTIISVHYKNRQRVSL